MILLGFGALSDSFPCVSQSPPALQVPDGKGMDRLIGIMIFENDWLQKEPLAKQAALVSNLFRKAIGIDLPMRPQLLA